MRNHRVRPDSANVDAALERSSEEYSGFATAVDEEAVFRRLRETCDPELRESVMLNHLQLVNNIVRKYSKRAEWEDLIQVGYVGLLKAVDGYDPERAVRFSTYATHCIEGEIRHYLRDRVDTIRKPRWLQSVSRKVAAFIERYLHERHRLPTVSEIAAGVNVSEEGVMEVLRARAPISIESMEEEDKQIEISRIRSKHYESFRLPLEDRIIVEQALEKLVDLERRVVYLFFYKDLNQRQIAGQMGLSPKKVSRLMKNALKRLKEFLGKDSG